MLVPGNTGKAMSGISDTMPETGMGDPEKLTPESLIRLEHFPAPPNLQPFITTIFLLQCGEAEIADRLPAGVGYLAIMLEGQCNLRFASGQTDRTWPETLLAPTNTAVALDAKGPLVLMAAALSPLGWAALTGLDAGQHRDRADDACALVSPDLHRLGERLRFAWESDRSAVASLANDLAMFISSQLKPLNPRHIKLVMAVSDWLSGSIDPVLDLLVQSVDYSPRQLERLVVRYFGCSPKLLARKYRALRVLALLQSPETDEGRIAELLNLFYDQSHLIREIRHFAGRTPGDLLGDRNSLLSAASALRNYREFRPNIARMPGD
jgi:AraC-like DNA-binding protein